MRLSKRSNPKLKVEKVITELGVGEALVSLLEDKGTPAIVQRTLIRPPVSRLGPVTAQERQTVMASSPVRGRYDQVADRESAYEKLKARSAQSAPAPVESAPAAGGGGLLGDILGGLGGTTSTGRGRPRQGLGEALAKSLVRSVGSQVGTQIVRGILGALLKR